MPEEAGNSSVMRRRQDAEVLQCRTGDGKQKTGRRGPVIPLIYATVGEEVIIRKIGGSPEVKKHLENLGFVAGGTVTLITALNGNLIVKVKESRVALNEELARKIMI
jgi:ferrous iron transport protein A